MSHGDAAAATRTCRGPGRRVAATPRLQRKYSAETSRGDAAGPRDVDDSEEKSRRGRDARPA